jgi:hypothetical protein
MIFDLEQPARPGAMRGRFSGDYGDVDRTVLDASEQACARSFYCADLDLGKAPAILDQISPEIAGR